VEIKEIIWKKSGENYYGKVNNTIVASVTKAFGNKFDVKVLGIQGSTTSVHPSIADEKMLMEMAEERYQKLLMEFLE
jgi:hypothetical protein